jgi:hypothetical protein
MVFILTYLLYDCISLLIVVEADPLNLSADLIFTIEAKNIMEIFYKML